MPLTPEERNDLLRAVAGEVRAAVRAELAQRWVDAVVAAASAGPGVGGTGLAQELQATLELARQVSAELP